MRPDPARRFFRSPRRDPDARLGDCWSAAIRYYYDKEGLDKIEPTKDWYPASIFFQGMKFMVFGDPTLPMGKLPLLAEPQAQPQPEAILRPVNAASSLAEDRARPILGEA